MVADRRPPRAIPPRQWIGLAALWSVLTVGAVAAHAQSGPPDEAARPEVSLDRKYMTGNWGGTRSDLEAKGVTLRAHHLSESAANPVGGLRQGAAYTEQVDAGADLDLGKLIGLSRAKLRATVTQRAGQSLAANAIGSIISAPFFRPAAGAAW